ncbi:MAG: amidase [Rhodanobacteraceae bacterium]
MTKRWLKEDATVASALALAGAIRTKEISVVEAVEAYLARIATVNPRLNAIVQQSDTVLAEARAADDALARNAKVGPLHGVPFTVKDWIETVGLICAAGHEARRTYVPKRDATVVSRMRAAGAILLGKTKPGATADVYPAPRNPYDLARTTGGSSSGEAALIAACGSPLGLGSDSGGSIRWPAHCCGVAGLKPTNGRVPNTGHVPPIAALADPRTVIGPLARSVDDLALTLPVIAGMDWHDASVVPMHLSDPASVDMRSLAIAHFTEFPGANAAADVTATVAAVVEVLAQAGASTCAATPPRIDESLGITRAYWSRPESISLKTWRPDKASRLSADDIERSLFEWDRLRRAFLEFMADVDVIVCPVAGSAAPAAGDYTEADYLYTLPFSLTGYPCVVVRAGTSRDGLPIGVQIVARPWCDHVALACGRIVERALGGWRPAPIEMQQ